MLYNTRQTGNEVRYTYFEIENYKGVEHARLDMDKAPRGRVHTIIGLNESGKTTVLEAIHLLRFREHLDALELPGYTQKDVHELIPVSKRANFNGRISVTAEVELDDSDQKLVRKRLQEEGVVLTEDIQPFKIVQYYEFESSRIKPGQPKLTWDVSLKGRTGKARKPANLYGEPRQKAWNIINSMLPRVVYFPNFLFEFPDKIYLENTQSPDEKKNAHYREVLQDVLDAIGNGTNLEQHVLARAKSGEEPDKKSLQSVLLEMSGHITKTVFDAWGKIFHRGHGQAQRRKEIVVSHEKDAKGWYLQLFLKDNHEQYEISERSLGFRWFFAYLLLTQYRGFRSRGAGKDVVFLLDEPASNLHSSAQAQLLESFASMPEKCSVIYTTHSHHLINPAWLENAYVVRNEGLHYTDTDDDYSAKRTTITLHRYRDFAVRHPDQTTYFQPVLDVLDYSPSRLENIPDVVMVEGKNDYYMLSLMKAFLKPAGITNLLPGTGSGALDSVIRLYLAWGRNFIVLLDSDKEGETQKKRYIEQFGSMIANRVFTLADVNPDWKKHEMEQLVAEADKLHIQQLAYPDTSSYNKTHFNRAVQELLVLKRLPDSLHTESRKNFGLVYDWIAATLPKLSGE